MRSYYGNVVIITGASSGIGKAIAEKLVKEGFRVYGTSRRAGDIATTAPSDSSSGSLKLIKLDVCSNDSVDKAVKYVFEAEGRIDILINCAGYGASGAIEETSDEEAFSQFDTNFFGIHRMCKSVLPIMRSQGKGLIVNIGSVAGLIAVPYQSMYSASKYAIEAFTDALRLEVKQFSIRAVVVEPGDTKTGFTDNRYFSEGSKKSSYMGSKSSIDKMIHDELNGPGPEQIANIVVKLTTRKNPPVRVTVGFVYKVFAMLKRLLPSRLVEFILSKMY